MGLDIEASLLQTMVLLWSCSYRDIPEQHPPRWKRAESGPDGDRTRSQPTLDLVPRLSPTASTPLLWLLLSWLMQGGYR